MGHLVPPYVVDRYARLPWEKRLAERYLQATAEDREKRRAARDRQAQLDALLRRIRDSGRVAAYDWLAEAALDPPELFEKLTVQHVLLETLLTVHGVPKDLLSLQWGELEGWQRRVLNRALWSLGGPTP